MKTYRSPHSPILSHSASRHRPAVCRSARWAAVLFASALIGQATVPRAEAATTWSGDTSGAWNVAANWGGTTLAYGNTLDIEFQTEGASNLYTFIAVTGTARSLIFNDNVDGDVTVRLSATVDGTGARGLRFSSDAPGETSPSIVVTSGASGNIDLGVAGGNFRLSSDLLIDHNGSGLLTISRPVLDGFGITKRGTGVTVLSAANTYTGGTKLEAGTLIINGSTAVESTVTVSAGAILGGSGTVGGDTTISGIHSPGTSPGVQTFTNSLTYENGSSVVWELAVNAIGTRGADFDGITVGTSLNFSGSTTFQLELTDGVSWSDGFWSTDHLDTAGWLVYTGASALTGFDNLDLADIDWLDGQGQALSAIRPGGQFSLFRTGNDIYLNYSAVPEPTTWALFGAGLILLAANARRRKA